MIVIDGRAPELTRDLPEGSDIHLFAEVDLGMEKTYSAYIPDQSATIGAERDRDNSAEVPDLRKWLEDCIKLHEKVTTWSGRLKFPDAESKAFVKINEPRAITELQAVIEVAGTDVAAVAKDARRRASQAPAERHGTLRAIERRVARDRIRWKIDQMRRVVEGVEFSQLEQLAADLRNVGDDQVAKLERRVDSLNWDVGGTALNVSFTFICTTTFEGAPGQLRWQNNGAVRLIQGNVNADTTADLTIFVKAAGPVYANWFVL